MAIYADFSVDQGASFIANLGIVDAITNDSDLTGFIVEGQLRRSYTSPTFVELDCEISQTIPGEITISLGADVTAGMKRGRWLYDIFITSPEGFRTRAVEGLIEVTPAVTQTL